jgi:hypothetical protein
MNLTWSLLGFLTCAQPAKKGLGSATLLMTSMSHAVFSLVFLYLDGGNMFGSGETKTRNGNMRHAKERRSRYSHFLS